MSKKVDQVDPELVELLAALPVLQFSADKLTELRAAGRGSKPVTSGDAIANVEVDQRTALGKEGSPVLLWIYRPRASSKALATVVYLHGGGFIAGSPLSHDAANRQLAAELNCIVVSVEYRLAPETRFPGNIEDCYAALAWVFTNARQLGADIERIGVMGESAGGGLAAALALLARDRGEYRLAFQHLTYPMLDDRTCVAADAHPYAGQHVFTRANSFFCWTALLGEAPGSDGVSPYAAPARAQDLTQLPQTYLMIGALDLFLEETLEWARRLARAGVAVELHVYPGAFHGFDLHPTASVACVARTSARAALMRFIHPPL